MPTAAKAARKSGTSSLHGQDANKPDLTTNPDLQKLRAQAAELLAGVTHLDVHPDIKGQVHEALSGLQQICLQSHAPQYKPQEWSTGSKASSHQASVGHLQRKCNVLEGKLQLARSIMRKLYYKNVYLAKELSVYKAGGCNASDLPLAQPPNANEAAAASFKSTPPSPEKPSAPVTTAVNATLSSLQQKDKMLKELQYALDASRRRGDLLENHVRQLTTKQRSHETGLQQAQAQTQMYVQKYRKIRSDYHKLLNRRCQAVSKAGIAQEAQHLLHDLQARLQGEMEEREMEAAMYSAKLYEQEKQLMDWYAEKHLLEEQLEQFRGQLRDRDQIDAEMDTCICSLFERVQQLEEQLEQQAQQEARPAREAGREEPPWAAVGTQATEVA